MIKDTNGNNRVGKGLLTLMLSVAVIAASVGASYAFLNGDVAKAQKGADDAQKDADQAQADIKEIRKVIYTELTEIKVTLARIETQLKKGI